MDEELLKNARCQVARYSEEYCDLQSPEALEVMSSTATQRNACKRSIVKK
ncbi:MAG: hypothetical protein LBT78_04500 [Tannerella sp.]|nr:hypothetical protein [Tannerella sp.]